MDAAQKTELRALAAEMQSEAVKCINELLGVVARYNALASAVALTAVAGAVGAHIINRDGMVMWNKAKACARELAPHIELWNADLPS